MTNTWHMLTTTTPWIVGTWPPLSLQLCCADELQFAHVHTRVWRTPNRSLPTVGQTVWAGLVADSKAGMSWDWVLLSRGSIAMADPMSVVSNLRFIREHGESVIAREAILLLNVLVHNLPWQEEVWRHLTEESRKAYRLGKSGCSDMAGSPGGSDH